MVNSRAAKFFEKGKLKNLIIEVDVQHGYALERITLEILADERLRLMGFDNRLIIACFANIVNILIWSFSTNDRSRS